MYGCVYMYIYIYIYIYVDIYIYIYNVNSELHYLSISWCCRQENDWVPIKLGTHWDQMIKHIYIYIYTYIILLLSWPLHEVTILHYMKCLASECTYIYTYIILLLSLTIYIHYFIITWTGTSAGSCSSLGEHKPGRIN